MLLADAAAGVPSEWEDAGSWESQAREEETPEETLHSLALELMAETAATLCETSSGDDGVAALEIAPSGG